MCCFCAHFVNTLSFSFFFSAFFIPYMHFIIFLLIIHFTHWCSVLYTLSACIRFLYFPQSNCVFIAVIYFAVYEQLWCAAVTVGEYWLQSLITEVSVYILNNMRRFLVKMIFLWVALCLDFEQSRPALKPKNTNTQNKTKTSHLFSCSVSTSFSITV